MTEFYFYSLLLKFGHFYREREPYVIKIFSKLKKMFIISYPKFFLIFIINKKKDINLQILLFFMKNTIKLFS